MADDPTIPRATRSAPRMGGGGASPDARFVPSVNVPRDPGVRASAADFGAQTGEAIAGTANVFGKLSADILLRRQEAEDTLFKNAFDAEARLVGVQTYNEETPSATNGAEGFQKRLDEKLAGKYEQIVGSLRERGHRPSQRGIDTVAGRALHFRSLYGVNAAVYENNVRVAQFVDQTKATLDSGNKRLLANPEDLDSVVKDNRENLESMKRHLPPDKVADIENDIEPKAQEAAIQGLILKNPFAAQDALEKGYYEKIPPPKTVAYLKAAQAASEKVENEIIATEAERLVASGEEPAAIVQRVEKNDWAGTEAASIFPFLSTNKQATFKKAVLTAVSQQAHLKQFLITIEESKAKKAKDDAQTTTQNDFLARMNLPDNDPKKLTPAEIINSNLDPTGSGSKAQFITMLDAHERASAKPIKTDPTLFTALWDRIHLPDDDPNRLRNENDLNPYMGRGLTVDNVNQLRAEIQGKRTPEGEEQAALKKGLIEIARGKLTRSNPLTGLRDPIGDELLQKFMSTVLREYTEKRRAGKTVLELLSPDSKEYLGHLLNTPGFVRSPLQIMQDIAKYNFGSATAAPSPAAAPQVPTPRPPRLLGETPEAYLKRIGQ